MPTLRDPYPRTARWALAAGALTMLVTVGAGAYGTHALHDMPEATRASWNTAVAYGAWHGLALIATGILAERAQRPIALGAAAVLFLAGVLLFSGGIYARTLLDAPAIAYATRAVPLGGQAWLLGWLCFLAGVVRRR